MACTIREMRQNERPLVHAFAQEADIAWIHDDRLIHHLSLLAWEASQIVGLSGPAAQRCETAGTV